MLRRPPYRFLPHAADWACRTSAQEPTFCRRARAQEHPAHGQIHRNGARPVQGLLERLTLGLGHLGAAASRRRQARDDFRSIEMIEALIAQRDAAANAKMGPVASLRCALTTRSSGRGRSRAAFRNSKRSNNSSATASPPVARSGIRTPPDHTARLSSESHFARGVILFSQLVSPRTGRVTCRSLHGGN